MMKQYLAMKEQCGDAILLFRCGDFYETFMEDAKVASEVLGITLTKKHAGKGETVPLAGVPYHSVQSYIYRLTRAGYRVAVCEQMEPPQKGVKLIQRELVRTITPGTIVEGDVIDGKENNFLAALYDGGLYGWGLAYVDITTGDFRATWESGQGAWEAIFNELSKVSASELLLDSVSFQDDSFKKRLTAELPSFLTEVPADSFNPATLDEWGIRADFSKVQKSLTPAERNLMLAPAGALLSYLHSTQKEAIDHLGDLGVYRRQAFMIIDRNTERNLELLNSITGGKRWSLLGTLDHTATAMGGRELREWILRPLLSPEAIKRRQDLVGGLAAQPALREELRKRLRSVHDIPRLLGRATFGNANARDLLSLRLSLDEIPTIALLMREANLAEICMRALRIGQAPQEEAADHTPAGVLLDDVRELRELLRDAIADEPPLTVREGGMIRDGYDRQLDEYRTIRKSGRGTIAQLQEHERNRTGIPSLKVAYNKVFGYYIEVTKAHLDKIPDDYIRKQTLTNAERFITPNLKEHEAKVLNAEDRMCELEYEILKKLLEIVRGYADRLRQTAERLARLDALASLAQAASKYSYVRPTVDTGDEIRIRDGRHPVLERSPAVQNLFVPNDTEVNNRSSQILIITGPNMAGKSTYIRQVALITIMAQMGSFVPATEANIGIIDRLFSRVGASDDLARGRSTFMVEMSEAALILNNATPRSLVILDEIGRGTSTFDGVSLAWAIVEYLHALRRRGVKTLFATHYHELAELENRLERVVNYHVRVSEQDGKVTFLYRIERGFSDHSYGIHVAELAGVPSRVTRRARKVLKDLESGDHLKQAETPQLQMSLFSLMEEPLRAKLAAVDTNDLSPNEAWEVLSELVEKAKKE